MIQITVPGVPVPKARPRITRTGHAYTPKRTAEYEKRVALCVGREMRINGIQPFEKAIRLTVTAVFAVPKSWTKSKREKALSGGLKHTTRPDGDNVLKAVKDALNGVIFDDDAQVFDSRIIKTYGEEPRTEIIVETE